MTTIVTRAGKGSPLTHTEVDTNFTNLNTNKFETAAIPLGTLAAPSISFVGRANTGIYSPAAETLAFVTAGSNRGHITSGGLVGIGTSTFSYLANKLVIDKGSTANDGITIVSSNTSNASIWFADGTTGNEAYRGGIDYNHSTDKMQIYTGASGNIVIDSSGRLGIGTTSPGSFTPGNLVVEAATTAGITISDSTGGGTASIAFSATSSFQNKAKINCTMSSQSLEFSTAGSERLRIDSSGRLLVGTSTARSNFYNDTNTAAIQVEGADNDRSALAIVQNFNSNTLGAQLILAKSNTTSIGSNTLVANDDRCGVVSFQGNDGTQFVEAAFIRGEVDGTPGANDMPGRLVFSTTADGGSSPTERMRITKLGVFKASNAGSYLNADSSVHEIRNNTDNNNVLIISSAASNGTQYGLSIRTANDQNDATRDFLECQGGGVLRAQIRTNGGLANYSANDANLSDRNVKKDITPAAGTWDCIKEWEIVNYRYKDQPDDANLNVGVIAQQVAESCPEVITTFQEAKDATEDKPAQEERLGVREQQMYWMAIKALQEAMGRIETLEQRLIAAGID